MNEGDNHYYLRMFGLQFPKFWEAGHVVPQKEEPIEIIEGEEGNISGEDIHKLLDEFRKAISDADTSEYCGKEFVQGNIILKVDAEGNPSFSVRGSDGTDREITGVEDLRSETDPVSLTELREVVSKFSKDILSNSQKNENTEKRLGEAFAMISRRNADLAEMVTKDDIADRNPVRLGELSLEFIEGNPTLVRTIGNERDGFERIEEIPSIAQGVSLSELSYFYDHVKVELLLRKMRQASNPEGESL